MQDDRKSKITEEIGDRNHLDKESIDKSSDLSEFIDALKTADIDKIQSLLEKGIDVDQDYINPNFADNDNQGAITTALHDAARFGPLELVQFLLKKGANPNVVAKGNEPNNDFTPLYVASAVGSTEIVKALLEHGANANIGKKPEDIARANQKWDVFPILFKYRSPTFHASERFARESSYDRQIIIDFLHDFKYPEELRRIIYTTNIVEGFHRQIRKYTKSKGAFTSENALLKLIYCACQKIL